MEQYVHLSPSKPRSRLRSSPVFAGQVPKLLDGMLPPASDADHPPSSDAWPAGQRFVQAPPALTGGAGLPKVTLAGPGAVGSSDNSGMSEAEAMQWNSQDWKWDPYAMRAMPVSQDGKTLGSKVATAAGVEPPASSGLQASQQPAKLPSLAMSGGVRSKSHPTCQVRCTAHLCMCFN